MISNEQDKLSEVTSLVLQQINEMAQTLQDRRKDLTEANKAIWAETPLIRNMDDALNLITISSEIAQHERQYATANIKLGQLKNMLNSPYFARIDFIEDGFSVESVYIGRNSLFDGEVFHVYDWRAPISSLYYDYGVGRASFSVPLEPGKENIITGEIVLKRQYHIVGGELIFLFDSELAIDDEILQFELARATEARIKTIINTIQKEQNKAIRSDAGQLLVFGPAGSGKTSVGLHRLAYLLYKHRGNLTSAKVRIFSPSPIFASYIEGIIPELGEENVESLDFPTLLTGYGHYDHYEQIDFLQLAEANDPRRLWIAEKFSPAFVDFLEGYLQGFSPVIDEDIYFNKDLICHKERIAELYKDRTSAGNLSSKTARVMEFVSRSYEEYFVANRKEITGFFSNLKDENLSDGVVRLRFDEQKNITLADLRNRLFPSAKKIYERVLRGWVKRGKKAEEQRDNSRSSLRVNYALHPLRWEVLLYEDALVLFYIDLLIGRIPRDNQVKHILLDEAQDINYLQHKILRQLYSGSQFTVLADVNQSLYPEIHLQAEDDLTSLYSGAEVIPLTTSYRSTYEISRFAAGVLGLPKASLYQRHGDEPQIIDAENCVATVAGLIDKLPETFNTVGILLSDIKKAEKFYNELKGELSGGLSGKLADRSHGSHGSHVELNKPSINKATSVTLISNRTGIFEPGIMVMAVPFAKGLEFDAVICPEYDTLPPKLLYLVATRALHQLYLLRGAGV